MARRAEDLPPTVVVIKDEFSTMSDEEYRDALARRLAELAEAEPIDVEVQRGRGPSDIREHGEA